MTDVVTVERVVPASPSAVFALLSDPRRHADFDGSGTVRQAKDVPDRLALGATFGMGMRMGLPYAMVSRVVEFEQDRVLAWQTVPAYPLVDRFTGGRVWRYELEPVEGGTLVRETWDVTKEKPLTRPAVRRLAGTTRTNMERTLERLAAVLAEPAAAG